jgi:type II secretory pathway pseudopilin PulG
MSRNLFTRIARRFDLGMSLVEVLAGVGVVAVVALFGIPMLTSQMNASDATIARVEARNVANAVDNMLRSTTTIGAKATVVGTPGTGTPTQIILNNSAGTPAKIAQTISMTAGATLDYTDKASNTVASLQNYCIAVKYNGATAYQGPNGPMTACTNGVPLSGSLTNPANPLLPLFADGTMPTTSGAISSCAYGAGHYICLPASGNQALVGDNYLKWVSSTLPATGTWAHIAFSNGLFVAVKNGSSAAISNDGLTWAAVDLGAGTSGTQWVSVVPGLGHWIALAADGSTSISANGKTWKASASTGFRQARAMAFGGGAFIAVGEDHATGKDNVAVRSNVADGKLTWQTVPLSVDKTWTSKTWTDITYGNGYFIAVQPGGTSTSTDFGTTWKSATTKTQYTHVTYGDTQFLLSGPNEGFQVGLSTDGLKWTEQGAGTRAGTWTAAVYGSGLWLLTDGRKGHELIGM